jgi:hypothetical protein
VPFFLCAVVLLPVLLRGCVSVAKAPSFVVTAIAAVSSYAAVADPIDSYRRFLEVRFRPDVIEAAARSLPVARGALMLDDQRLAVLYVQERTRPREKVYVGVSRHDDIFSNDAMFYFLVQRDSATRYHELHPGVADTAPVQHEIANELERNKVTYVVLTERSSRASPGVTVLDTYISNNYRSVQRIGAYDIFRRVTAIPVAHQ